jgi:hypothetical protein
LFTPDPSGLIMLIQSRRVVQEKTVRLEV